MDPYSILYHLGEDRESYGGATNPPIHQSSNFTLPTVAALRERLTKEFDEPFYTRGYNPTVAVLREKIAALEGAEDALVFSSGSGAIAATVMSIVKGGDHVICVEQPYTWTNHLFNHLLKDYGVETTMVDGRDVNNFSAAIQPNTKLIYLESPNSITFELQDIKAVSDLAREKGIITILDNSYSSPIFQQPLALGIDFVCHSASKYLSGHSDVVAGIVCGSKEKIRSIFTSEFMCLGANISPFDAAMMIKGIRTLPLRMERTAKNAVKVAAFLENHPKINKLNWPFATSFAQKHLAHEQMTGCGGLMSIEINAENFDGIERFCDALKYFMLACSWGGFESLQFPMCSFAPNKESYAGKYPWNLVRLYVGLEDPEELLKDLDHALEKV